MYKSFVFMIGLLFTAAAVLPQTVRMTDSQRLEQADFIRNDTLPVNVVPLPGAVNTRFSEYGGQLLPDSTFLFTSMRSDRAADNEFFFETNWYCSIYESRLLAGGLYAPAVSLGSRVNDRKFFNGSFCYEEHSNKLIFSRCSRSGDGELKCSLLETGRIQKRGQAHWDKPVRLPQTVNLPGYSAMHPWLVYVSPQEQVLYFVSDRPGGQGGLDIWYTVCNKGRYGEPVNLGIAVNTEGNEVTPFYDTTRETLFFSSDEHLGIGGYDIFWCPGALSQWGEVSNMGVPFNSDYNDCYFSLNPDGESGYFSSNRPQAKEFLEDTCCNDLFSFRWMMPADTAQPDVMGNPEEECREQLACLEPVSLYFQNDCPDPRSLSDTTETDYMQLHLQYMAAAGLYVSRAGEGLHGDTLVGVQQSMLAFLRDSVDGSCHRLTEMLACLKEALLNGDTVTLSVCGFASPLHSSDYNLHLSSRRIVSFLNYLRKEDNGFFEPYMTGQKTGLILRTDARGAASGRSVSAAARETVYGLQAAKDRKITISVLITKS